MRLHRVVVLAISLSAATLLVRAPNARADGPAAEQPVDPAKAEAIKKFEDGSKAFAEKRYKDAIDLFLDADAVVHNADLAYNTSLAYEAMGDAASALNWAREYLRRAPNAEDRAAVEKRIGSFEQRLQQKGIQQVTVLSSPTGATVVVDGHPVGVTPWTGELRPGSHEVSARNEGYREAKQHLDLRPERAAEIKLELTKEDRPATPVPTPAPPPRRTRVVRTEAPAKRGLVIGGITGLVAGAAGLGVGIGLELMRSSAEADARAEPVQIDAAADLDRMESYQLGARVAVGIGAGLAAIGGTMLAVGFALKPEEHTETIGVVVDCQPGVPSGLRPCMVGLRGRF